MLHLSKKVNELKQRVEVENMEKRTIIWKNAENSFNDFPLLDENDLCNITCVIYQLKLASSYMQEHLKGNCDILVHQEDHHLIRVNIQSQHTSAKKYQLWIQYDSNQIVAWYCKCKAGARVVGVCAHIASVVWYLGYARHNSDRRYGVRNWGDFVEDANVVP